MDSGPALQFYTSNHLPRGLMEAEASLVVALMHDIVPGIE